MRIRKVLYTLALLALCSVMATAADVSGKWTAQIPGMGGEPMDFSGSDDPVDFRDLLDERPAVSLSETTHHDEVPRSGSPCVLRHLQDHVNRLLLRGAQEGTRVDDDGVGGRWIR